MPEGEADALAEADGEPEVRAVAVALADALAAAVVPADALAPAEEDGLAETVFSGLESSTTPQTTQVRCCRPSIVEVGSSTVVQSEAICPGAGIISV